MSNAINSILPFPLGYDKLRSRNFTLTNNHTKGRIIFGYGINYSIYTWERKGSDYDEDPLALPHSKKDSHAFGTSLSLHNQFANYLRFGITYNPTFYSVFPKDEWLYQHVISLEVIFRLPLNEKFKLKW